MRASTSASPDALTIADGIAVKRPGEITAPLLEQWVDEVVVAGEDDIAEAMVLLMDRSKLVVEGAGAVGVAALLAGARGAGRVGHDVRGAQRRQRRRRPAREPRAPARDARRPPAGRLHPPAGPPGRAGQSARPRSPAPAPTSSRSSTCARGSTCTCARPASSSCSRRVGATMPTRSSPRSRTRATTRAPAADAVGYSVHGRHLQRGQPRAAGPLRHPAAGRPPRGRSRSATALDGRGRGVHRGARHALPRDGRRAAAGRRARTRAATRGSCGSLDERTLAFPNYDGNGMYLSWGNALRQPGASGCSSSTGSASGVCASTARRRSTTTIRCSAAWPGAQFVVRVTVREVYPNCPRYIHRMELVERSRFVPRPEEEPPGARVEAHRVGERRAAGGRPRW